MGTKKINEKFVVIGGGGHSASVVSAVEDKGRIIGILDNYINGDILGVKIIGDDSKICELLRNGLRHVHVAIGDNKIRREKTEECIQKGLIPVIIIDKTASVDASAVIGQGCFIGKNAIVNARAVIGQNCIINSGAIIEHDCEVGDGAHCAPGSVLCGGVRIGRLCLIGANATVIPSIKIADNITVGAGSVVINDLETARTYAGSPAVQITKKESQ